MTDPVETLVGLGLAGRMTWAQVAQCFLALDGTDGNVIRDGCAALLTTAQAETFPWALRATKASPWSLLYLGVSGHTIAGEDLPTLDPAELQRRMTEVWCLSLDDPSPWLRGYAARLLRESRRRRGVGRAAS